MKHYALVIGRFQLVGNQHVDLFSQIIDHHKNQQKIDKLHVAIGVALHASQRNPFSYKEAWEMIKPIVIWAANEMNVPFSYRIVEDIGDDGAYADHLAKSFNFRFREEKVTLFSSNEWTLSCFLQKHGYKTVHIIERIPQHSTILRSDFIRDICIKDRVPVHVPALLEFWKGKNRLIKFDKVLN